ncbi:hypothetical protein THAOC_28721 [Thalassiosira oceanica]|uniref:Uncharacterized protein n=1 Tax=Thalassiosira oceanica TaxID=159749 RepID=K0RIE4_THAOC|nr:hypothetical protein THAOC_28721 [Thalassiosira oceanica]|eukprot:EJK52049.1 hypothetical protein THAOC_28721 [Thalassiosira oceanica]
MEEDKVQPRPSVRSGASLEELEAFVELSSMPTPRNDAAHARLAPEEIPIYNGIVVPTERTRFQTWAEHFRDNYKSIIGLMILAIASAVTVGIVLDRRRNNIPNMDILEPPVDPADLQFDPDDTTGILGMDMLPPGSEGSEQSPTDPSSSEVNYDPSEEELQMQEILKLEAEQNKAMMPEGWDPNNPKASLDALKDQNTVPSEETELGASMSEEEAYQGDPLMQDDPMFDDPMYDPNSPEFDEAALAELDEESLSILAEKYGDEIMDKLPDGPPLEEEPIENEFDPANPMYDPSSPEFDEAALGELDQKSLATLADMYGDEFRDKLPEELEEEPIENEFDSTDPMYDPSSPEFDEAALGELDEESLSTLADMYGDEFRDKLSEEFEEEPIENEFDPANPMYDPSSPEFDELALGELDEESLATLAEKYGDEIMEYGDEGELGEDQLDPTNDPSLDTINFNDPKYDHNSAFYDPEAVNELSDADKVLIEKMYGKITYEEPAYEDEITPIEDPMDPAYDPAEEPFDELGDPGDDLDEAQMEEYEDTADMATASPPPLADMPTSATGMPPGAEIGQEPNWDPAFTPAPVGEGEDEMNLYPEDEPGYPEDEPGPGEDVEEKWGLENEWPLGPTDKPTPRPTVLYVPYDYDESPEEGTAVEAGDAGDEVFYHGLEPQIGPVGKYLDGVGSPEEIEEDKNVQVVGGVLLALFLVLVLVTAHSVMNNPDGLCAG